jgi:thymidylate synthase (FAD)
MKLIKPNVVILEQQPGLDGMYKQIELAGRTCYKSEDKITEDSAKAFVDRMIASGHGAMLEHGTIYLRIPSDDINYHHYLSKYEKNPYSRCNYGLTLNGSSVGDICITSNYRVLVENNWLDDLQYICEPTEYHEKRITVKWTLDRGVSHEFVRHRVFSFAQESTRYCNYSKDKFGNELTFIIPSWLDILEGSYAWDDSSIPHLVNDDNKHNDCDTNNSVETATNTFMHALQLDEFRYLELLKQGWKPQQARQVLPNALKTELVMTGFESDWKHFFSLRSPKYGAKGVHPDAAYLADKLYDMMYIEKDICLSFVHSDEFDGKNNLVKDGDMITYNTIHDKNKDEYTIDSVTITPRDGKKKYLSREEYFKSLMG